MPVLIVLDSNQFYGDVYARRGRLSAVLNGARNGDFAVLVPRVVIDELSRQFPERVAAARKNARTALKNFAVEFKSLEIQLPELAELDEEALAAAYRDTLEARLAEHGVGIGPYPAMDGLIAKAVAHRKPFGPRGQGFADALIWKNVLEAARTADQVVFVTDNTADFGDGADPPGLAEVIRLTDEKSLSSVDLESRSDEGDTPVEQRWSGAVDGAAGRVYQDALEALRPVRIGELASVDIGFVSGANDYFVLSSDHAAALGLPPSTLAPTVRRPSDVPGLMTADSELHWLLALDGEAVTDPAVLSYLEHGEGSAFRSDTSLGTANVGTQSTSRRAQHTDSSRTCLITARGLWSIATVPAVLTCCTVSHCGMALRHRRRSL